MWDLNEKSDGLQRREKRHGDPSVFRPEQLLREGAASETCWTSTFRPSAFPIPTSTCSATLERAAWPLCAGAEPAIIPGCSNCRFQMEALLASWATQEGLQPGVEHASGVEQPVVLTRSL